MKERLLSELASVIRAEEAAQAELGEVMGRAAPRHKVLECECRLRLAVAARKKLEDEIVG